MITGKYTHSAEFLLKCRTKNGLSQPFLALYFECTNQYISGIERGLNKFPAKWIKGASLLFCVSDQEVIDVIMKDELKRILIESEENKTQWELKNQGQDSRDTDKR